MYKCFTQIHYLVFACQHSRTEYDFIHFLCSWPTAQRYMRIFMIFNTRAGQKNFQLMLVQTFGMANTTPPTTLCWGWPVMCDLMKILENTIIIICFINFCTTQACQIPPIPVLASQAALRISKFRMRSQISNPSSVSFSRIPLSTA